MRWDGAIWGRDSSLGSLGGRGSRSGIFKEHRDGGRGGRASEVLSAKARTWGLHSEWAGKPLALERPMPPRRLEASPVRAKRQASSRQGGNINNLPCI